MHFNHSINEWIKTQAHLIYIVILIIFRYQSFAHYILQIYTCVYICVCVYIYVCIYMCVCICVYIYVYICVYVYMCVYVYVHVCMCMYMCVYVYVCVCVYVCMYAVLPCLVVSVSLRLPTLDCSPPGSSVLGVFRQEHWSGLPFLSPWNLPNPGIEPASTVSPALQADSLPTKPSGKPNVCVSMYVCHHLTSASVFMIWRLAGN